MTPAEARDYALDKAMAQYQEVVKPQAVEWMGTLSGLLGQFNLSE